MSWLARLKKTDAKPAEAFRTPLIETAAAAANDPTANPDRWCWPNSDAMNTAEINTFMARVRQFKEQGLSESEAEAMADKLMLADRKGKGDTTSTTSPKPEPTRKPAPTHKLWMDSQQPPDTPTSCNGGSKANPFTIEPGAWRPLAQAYHAHHFGCPVCVAAGLGYGLRCGADAALWVAYHDQPRDCGAGGQYP